MMSESDKLNMIDKLKTKLNITWDSAETQAKLCWILENAEIYMNHLLGVDANYTTPGHAQLLIINYSLYVWNDCENDFENAYQKDILRARALYEVKTFEEKNAST